MPWHTLWKVNNKVAHGDANGALLAEFVKFAVTGNLKKFGEIAELMGKILKAYQHGMLQKKALQFVRIQGWLSSLLILDRA